MVKKNQRRNNILILLALIAVFLSAQEALGRENYPFSGQVNSDEINIRSDSTISSAVICQLNKGEEVAVVSRAYGWYKINLPKKAPAFIKANLITLIDEKTAKVSRTNVNIRLKPEESSPVIGQADLDEIINILEKVGGWYKIEPLKNSFGWIYSKFVDKKVIKRQIISK
ncbi:MAG: SH3 domain-containing protein [Candidatus Omnitrophica bacterium]|nr:SH3 domain-containing protein [Candidatus Omnitrophota bacterium]